MDTKEQLVQTPAPEPAAPGPVPVRPKKKKRRAKKIIKRIIAIVIVLAILGGIAYGMLRLFSEKDETVKEIMPGYVYTGSIQSMVYGSGVTKPRASTSITLSASGVVQEVFVGDGDWVNEGDPLYIIDSSEAQEAVEAARKTVENYQKQLEALQKSYENLAVRAPYSGKLLDVSAAQAGDFVGAGSRVATLVDDSTMLLTLYFSYAYENDIREGQSARITVPSTMTQCQGSVESISYVDYVSPEGGRFFEVVLAVPNPGTFTEGTAASAQLTAADGTDIYPYDSGALAFSRKTEIVAQVSGDAEYVKLKNYLRVSAGELLMQISGEDNDAQLATLENQIKTAEEALAAAEGKLGDFQAVSPMTGTVLSCALTPGQEVTAGSVAISIADTSVMTIEAQVDEMNVSYVKPGVFVDVTQYGRDGMQMYMGVVSSISMEGNYQNGVSYFPAIITVENPTGTLMSGMYVDYSLLASQSENCLLVPVQAVKYTEQGTCLFIKAEEKPENAFDTEILGIEVPEGYYAVPVTVGLSDNNNAEIVEGVADGTEVFVQYIITQGDSYGGW